MMHEYQHFVDYGPATDRVSNPYQTPFIGSPVGALTRPGTTATTHVTAIPGPQIKLEPQPLSQENSDISKPYKCYQCGYSSSLKSNLNQHITCVHASAKPFKCSLCNYAAAIKSNLNQHIQCVHVKTKLFITLCLPACNDDGLLSIPAAVL